MNSTTTPTRGAGSDITPNLKFEVNKVYLLPRYIIGQEDGGGEYLYHPAQRLRVWKRTKCYITLHGGGRYHVKKYRSGEEFIIFSSDIIPDLEAGSIREPIARADAVCIAL